MGPVCCGPGSCTNFYDLDPCIGTLALASPEKTVGEDPALQIGTQFTLDMRRQGTLTGARALEKGIQMADQDQKEKIFLRLASLGLDRGWRR